MSDLNQYRRSLDGFLFEWKRADKQVKVERETLREAKQELYDIEAAQAIAQQIAQAIQQIVHSSISSVVSRCLEVVFGEYAYEFHIEFERKRGKTEASLVFKKNGNTFDPIDETEGGQVDVASFALRVASLLLMRPAKRRLIVTDEPFRFVNGEEYQERVGEMVETLANEMGIQFLIVSDDDWLKIGKVVHLTREKQGVIE